MNPWSTTFSCRNADLDRAGARARGDPRERLQRPAVLLVSDLDDDPIDLPASEGAIGADERRRDALYVVALNPSPEDERFFRRLLREPDELRFARLPAERCCRAGGRHLPGCTGGSGGRLRRLALAAARAWGARLTWRAA